KRTNSLVFAVLFAWHPIFSFDLAEKGEQKLVSNTFVRSRHILADGSGASRLTTILITTHHIQKRPCQGCEAPPEAARP
ncbi:MAG: hypothetical protein IKX10_00605, partial [Lachnospiraceae bacterium]|nr:hypothetical protein [Lachnospiraceae bacterium]